MYNLTTLATSNSRGPGEFSSFLNQWELTEEIGSAGLAIPVLNLFAVVDRALFEEARMLNNLVCCRIFKRVDYRP